MLPCRRQCDVFLIWSWSSELGFPVSGGGGGSPAPRGIGKGFVHQKMERSKTSFEWLCGAICGPKGVQWSQKALFGRSGGGIFCSESEIFGLCYGHIIYYVFERKQNWKSLDCCQSVCLALYFGCNWNLFAIFMLPIATFIDLGAKPGQQRCPGRPLTDEQMRPKCSMEKSLPPDRAIEHTNRLRDCPNGVKWCQNSPQKWLRIIYKKTTISFQKSWLLASLLLRFCRLTL